jgi:hypothetical protein
MVASVIEVAHVYVCQMNISRVPSTGYVQCRLSSVGIALAFNRRVHVKLHLVLLTVLCKLG